ncbi:hypothetical protein F8R89_30910 [Streptomyces sp. SS1-1]|uniref:hypothetical protein n=1 Tax=Streptomyces sp. SS1-1 TaxID=2651869 RepID=UPI00124F9E10|nr:hypothetical protein [Streptomyces sp. SS1-1]KAB2976020.1 hypothetical protein F8R89_30910 [Streptomyces sp. SS1-1]
MSRRPSRAEMLELAADREKCAARSQRAAQSAREAAANPANSDTTRRQAAATIRIAENHARDYREEAAALRDGRIPGEDW